MFIDLLNFTETDDSDNEWSINNFSFQKINLIVGKNSVGKSRTLSVVAVLAELVVGEKKKLEHAKFEICFKGNAKKIQYILEYEQFVISKEMLLIDDRLFLKRGKNGEGEIYAEQLKKNIEFQVPEKNLACVARRDSVQHSYFENLYNWGQSVRHYLFHSQLGKDQVSLSLKTENKRNMSLNAKDTRLVVAFFKRGIDEYGEGFVNLLLDDINGIGYQITEIGVCSPKTIIIKGLEGVEALYIKEKGHSHVVDQNEMSHGLFRAMSLFIQLRYSEKFSKPGLVLIDDIGEGLDYERAELLIHAIIEIVKKSNIQLIMTTNNRFVMNNVNLEYWCILQRDGGKCSVLNYTNAKDVFDEFELTGLSNFDFFSSQYYARSIRDEK